MSRVFRFACLSILLCAAPARAEDPPPHITARLDYVPAQGCPPASVLRGEVARRLGYDPFIEAAPLRVVATITRGKNALAGSVELYDSASAVIWREPTTPATDCRTVVIQMAGKLAFRLDPLLYPSAPVEPPPPLPSPKSKQEFPPMPIEPPAKALAGRVVLGLSSQIVISATGVSEGLVGALGWRWPVVSRGMDLAVGMEFRFDAPSSTSIDDVRPGATMQTYLMGGSIVSCLHGRHLFGCAVASGGVLEVSSSGLDSSDGVRQELGFLGGGARFGLEDTLRPWLAVRLYGEALVSRPLFGLVNHAEVRGPSLLSSPLTGTAGLSLVAYLEGPR